MKIAAASTAVVLLFPRIRPLGNQQEAVSPIALYLSVLKMSDPLPAQFLHGLRRLLFGEANDEHAISAAQCQDSPVRDERGEGIDCDTAPLRGHYLRQAVLQAQLYRDRIRVFADRLSAQDTADSLQSVLGQVCDCVDRLCRLARRLDDMVVQPEPELAPDVQSAQLSGDSMVLIPVQPGMAPDTSTVFQAHVEQLVLIEQALGTLGYVYSLLLYLDGRDIAATMTMRIQDDMSRQLVPLQQALDRLG